MTADSTIPAFIAISQLAEVLGVPCRSLRRWSTNGTMPAPVRFGGTGGQRYWKIELLKAWIATMDKLPENMQTEVWENLESHSAPLPKKTRPKK